LAGLNELTSDDVVRLVRERLLWNGASPALEVPNYIAGDLREPSRWKPHDSTFGFIEFRLQIFLLLTEEGLETDEQQREQSAFDFHSSSSPNVALRGRC
jgi:hypothetical protein